MKILYIEDDGYLAYNVSKVLKKSNINVHTVNSSEGGIIALNQHEYDVILLDYKLGEILSNNVINQIRKSGEEYKNIPIIILSAITDTNSKIIAMSTGADDYITKPFSNNELISRIYALTRRKNGYYTNEIKIGHVKLDLVKTGVEIGGKKIELTNTEYNLLKYLCLHPGIISKDMILNHLYSNDKLRGRKVIDVFICKLRKKCSLILNDPDENAVIETVWGRGYRINVSHNLNSSSSSYNHLLLDIPLVAC